MVALAKSLRNGGAGGESDMPGYQPHKFDRCRCMSFSKVALAGWDFHSCTPPWDEMCRPLSSAARVVEMLMRKAAESEASGPREMMVAKSWCSSY